MREKWKKYQKKVKIRLHISYRDWLHFCLVYYSWFGNVFLQDKIIYQPYSFNIKQLPLEEPYYGNWGYKITDESEFLSRKKGWRVVELNTGEGVTLHNYWMQSGRSDSVPTTFLYFHGNGDRIVTINNSFKCTWLNHICRIIRSVSLKVCVLEMMITIAMFSCYRIADMGLAPANPVKRNQNRCSGNPVVEQIYTNHLCS